LPVAAENFFVKEGVKKGF